MAVRKKKKVSRQYTEPELFGHISDIEMMKVHGWYISFYSSSDMIPWVAEWAEGENYSPETVQMIRKKGHQWIGSTTAINCRLANRGVILSPAQVIRIKDKINEFVSRFTNDVEPSNVVSLIPKIQKKTPADVVNEKIDRMMAEIESQIDDNLETSTNTFSLYSYIKKNDIPQRGAKTVIDFYTPIIEDDDTDKKTKIFLKDILADAQKWYDVKKSTRKPRVVKPKIKTLENNVKCLKEGEGIVSDDPKDIPGATMVIVYNTNLSEIGFYKSKDPTGLKVDRQTFLNYDESASKKKRVSKLGNLLTEIQNMTSLEFQNKFNSLKNGSKPMLSRINDKCLIVKIIKG